MGSHETLMVPTPDGRELEVLVAGSEAGFPLVFHHWIPGAAVPFGILERAATDRGLQVISYSRPGYGRSTPRADADSTATVADDALDTATILNRLGLGGFITVAWSGGGPRGFACAAVLPDRCLAAATLASPVPPDAEGFDPLAGMTAQNVEEYTATHQGTQALTANLEEFVAPLLHATDDQIAAALRAMFGPSITGELAEYAVACMKHSVHQGVVGWRDDNLTHTRWWGFDLAHIRVPMSIWHGVQDANLAPAHGVWLSQHVPRARFHSLQDTDHISIILRIESILNELLELAGLQNRSASASVTA